MSVTYTDLQSLWGDRLVHFPLDKFDDVLGPLGPELFPPNGAQPIDVPILFTSTVTYPQMELYTQLELEVGEEKYSLIVLGASPRNEELLFCLNADTGTVLLLDLGAPALELCNSSYAAFVEFLYRLGQLIATDPGGRERARRAVQLHDRLQSLDPVAFEDPEAWWPMAFAQLESTGS